MKTALFALWALAAVAGAQNLTVTVPAGCTATPAAVAVTCGVTPPACTPPQVGTPPNCTNPVCVPPQTGTWPNCVTPPPSDCSAFTKVVTPATANGQPLNWANPQNVYTTNGPTGGFGPTDVVVIAITTGASTAPNQYGHITGAEWTSQTSMRNFALSTRPCDFSAALGLGAAGSSTTTTVNFSVGPNGSGYYPQLQPNTTYYFNVSNQANSACDPSLNCNMLFTLQKPPGLLSSAVKSAAKAKPKP